MTSGFPRAAVRLPVRLLIRLLMAVTVAVAALTALAAPSSAHAALTGTDPKAGATLDALPATVRLTFSDPLDPQFVRVRVTAPDGTAVGVEPTVKGQSVTLSPDDGGAGKYTVAYRVVSKDGHPVSGTLTFTVRAAAQPSASAEPSDPAGATPTAGTTATPTGSGTSAPTTDGAGTATPAPSPGAPTVGTDDTGQVSSAQSVGVPTGTIVGVVAVVLLLGAGAAFAVRRRAR